MNALRRQLNKPYFRHPFHAHLKSEAEIKIHNGSLKVVLA